MADRAFTSACSGVAHGTLEMPRVELHVLLPFVRHLILRVARVDRTGLDARVAVDAVVRIDEQVRDLFVVRLVGRRVDAVHGTYLDARVVLRSDARFGYHVRQGDPPRWLARP